MTISLWRIDVKSNPDGVSIVDTAARGKARIRVPAAAIIARGPALIDVVPGVLAEECLALHG